MIEKAKLSATDRATVDADFGFAVPDIYFKLLQLVKGEDGSVDGKDFSLYQGVTGLLLGSWRDAYPSTPPELFLIGRTGMDGVNCGCVIHDTRLSPAYPLAMFSPNELRCTYLGADTRSSLGMLIGNNLAGNEPNEKHEEDVKRVITALGFDPAELPDEPPIGLVPRMPPGWKLAMTADGLGVAAEAKFFAPDQDFALDLEGVEGEDVEAYLEPAAAAAEAGHHATALWHLRNAFTFNHVEGLVDETLTEPMTAAYNALGRPYLADMLAKIMSVK